MEPDLKETDLGPIAWKILFNEDPETIPDPNKPENVPHIEAVRKEKIQKFKRFAMGPGKPLFEQWQNEIRVGMFNLLIYPDCSKCNCVISNMLDKLQYLLKLITKAQQVVNDKAD